MKHSILIIGSSGYLGSNLKKFLSKKHQIIDNSSKKKINICNYNKLENFFKKNKVDFLINCSGQISSNKKKFKRESLIGNKNIILLAKKFNFKVIFLSTTSVLGKNKDIYISVKLKSEDLYLQSDIDYKILRIGNVYDSNFKKKGLLKNLVSYFNGKIDFIKISNIKIYRNFIHIDDFSSQVSLIIDKWKKLKSFVFIVTSENLKLSSIIKFFALKYPLKIVKNKVINLDIKKENNLFINSKFFAKNILKYKKTIFLRNTIKKFQYEKSI